MDDQLPLEVPEDTPTEALNKLQKSLELRIDLLNKTLKQIGKELHDLSSTIQRAAKK